MLTNSNWTAAHASGSNWKARWHCGRDNYPCQHPDPPKTKDELIAEWDGCENMGTVNVPGLGDVPSPGSIYDSSQEVTDLVCKQNPGPRAHHVGVYFDQKVYVLGGLTNASTLKAAQDMWYRDDRLPRAALSVQPEKLDFQKNFMALFDYPDHKFRARWDEEGTIFEYMLYDADENVVVRTWDKTRGKAQVNWLDKYYEEGPGSGTYIFYIRALDPAGNVDISHPRRSGNLARWRCAFLGEGRSDPSSEYPRGVPAASPRPALGNLRRSPFALIFAALDYGPRPSPNAGEASPNARHLFAGTPARATSGSGNIIRGCRGTSSAFRSCLSASSSTGRGGSTRGERSARRWSGTGGRADILPVGPGLALSFKRMSCAFQRHKNQQERCSRGRKRKGARRYAIKRMRRKFKGAQKDLSKGGVDWRKMMDDDKKKRKKKDKKPGHAAARNERKSFSPLGARRRRGGAVVGSRRRRGGAVVGSRRRRGSAIAGSRRRGVAVAERGRRRSVLSRAGDKESKKKKDKDKEKQKMKKQKQKEKEKLKKKRE